MATLPTADDKARMVLRIYQHFNARPGHVLLPNNFVTLAAILNVPMSDLNDGLEHGVSLGWLEQTPTKSFRLTQAGFDKM